MKWFRFYSEALDDPKVQRLPAELFKFWVNVLCLAARRDGPLPSEEDAAFGLRIGITEYRASLAELDRLGFFDHDGDETAPHNWAKRQYASDTSTPRVQKHRSRNGAYIDEGALPETPVTRSRNGASNVSSAVSETPGATAPEQSRSRAETEAEQSRADAPSLAACLSAFGDAAGRDPSDGEAASIADWLAGKIRPKDGAPYPPPRSLPAFGWAVARAARESSKENCIAYAAKVQPDAPDHPPPRVTTLPDVDALVEDMRRRGPMTPNGKRANDP